MSYVEQNLMPGEQIVYQTKLHWIIFLRPVLLLIIAIPLLFFATTLAARVRLTDVPVPFWVFLVFLGSPLVFAILNGLSAFVTYVTSEFGVTDRRVMIKTGFIRRNSLETLLTKIEAIGINQNIPGRIFGYGTIVITGTGGTDTPFHRINAPFEFRRQAQEQIAAVQGLDGRITEGSMASAAPNSSVATRLRELKSLLEEGLITQGEYERKRVEILGEL